MSAAGWYCLIFPVSSHDSHNSRLYKLCLPQNRNTSPRFPDFGGPVRHGRELVVLLMTKHLERDLDTLQRDIVEQAAAVEEAIYKAIRSLQERDVALARQVIAEEPPIDRQENAVEEECLKILALHQPVAIDLRRVVTILQINIELERMADLAVAIAERALVLAEPPLIRVPEKLQAMTDMTASMVRQSLDSFVNLDSRLARRVHRLDDEVDRYNDE